MMSQYPLSFGQCLQALAYALSKPRETAIVGDSEAADTQALLVVVREGYRPFQEGGSCPDAPTFVSEKHRGHTRTVAHWHCSPFATRPDRHPVR